MAKKYQKVTKAVDKFYEKLKKNKKLSVFQQCHKLDKYLSERGL
jgi:hypothetical protein